MNSSRKRPGSKPRSNHGHKLSQKQTADWRSWRGFFCFALKRRKASEEWSKHTGVAVQFHLDENEERYAPEIETTGYCIAQEALNNIAKHAMAKAVSVILQRRQGILIIIIEDEGRGFNVNEAKALDSKKLGLLGMRERAALVGGTVEIESRLDGGTTVFIRLPLTTEANSESHSRMEFLIGTPHT